MSSIALSLPVAPSAAPGVASGVATTSSAFDVRAAYHQHSRFIANAITGLTGPGPHVEEILQETFIIAHKKAKTFTGQSLVTTWLYGIARNLCRRHRRSLRRLFAFRERYAAQPELVTAPTPEQDLVAKERLATFHRALAELSADQREVFVLFELEEMGGQEIAELLSLPLGTVWTRLRAARERFEKSVRRLRAKEGSS